MPRDLPEVSKSRLGKLLALFKLLTSPFDFFEKESKRLGDIYAFSIGKRKYVIVLNPDVLSQFAKELNWNLTKRTQVSHELSPLMEVTPGFLQFTDGYFHQVFRGLGKNQYTSERIGQFMFTLIDNFDDICSRIIAKRNIGIESYLREAIVMSICKDTFGIEITKQDVRLHSGARKKVLMAHRLYQLFGSLATTRFLPFVGGFRHAAKVAEKMFSKRLNVANQCPVLHGYIDNFCKLNDSRKFAFSDKNILDDVGGYISASEAIVVSVLWALSILRERPDAEQEIRNELQSLKNEAGSNKIPFKRMNFTRSVVLETLRLYPPFPMFEYTLMEELVINSYRFPARTSIVVPIFNIHRDSRWHEYPERFNPSRWLDNTWGIDTSIKYLPFGFGPRRCIAWEQSIISITVLLGLVLEKFEFQRSKKIKRSTILNIPGRFEGLNYVPKYKVILKARDHDYR